MTDRFVSYAQNYEDVMLWRALGGERERPGCWVDVGAWDPIADSVTYAFYLRGWHGLNLEPNPEIFPRLAAIRTGDINLQLGAGETDGTVRFWQIPNSGLSTGDLTTAEMHRALGMELEPMEVPVRRLAALCDEHGIADIDFLKVDAEGMERAVLAGAELARLRPRIILVEATKPNSQEQTHDEWSGLITDAGYTEVYFDGLNRFYLADEHHAALAGCFATPPNVFDRFVRAADEARVDEAQDLAETAERAREEAEAGTASARREREEAEAMAASALRERDDAVTASQAARQAAADAEHAAAAATIALQAARAELAGMQASLSWRGTKPLRRAAEMFKQR